MTFPRVKGPKNGICNICGETGPLTEDHVPPKGVTRFPRMALHNLVGSLGAELGERGKPRHFQQGVKFRTTCLSCNRDLLGSQYDKALINLSNDVSRYLFSQLDRPSVAHFNTQPGLVAKAVCGHILSVGVGYFPRGEMGDVLADFVLDPAAPAPEELRVYYWIYPYWDQVLVRAMSMLPRFGAPPVVVSLMKYMPLAFLVVWHPDPILKFPYPNLINYMPSDVFRYADIPLDFTIIPPHRYPEMPTNKGIALHGRDAFRATRIIN